jgi:hypothetical protein
VLFKFNLCHSYNHSTARDNVSVDYDGVSSGDIELDGGGFADADAAKAAAASGPAAVAAASVVPPLSTPEGRMLSVVGLYKLNAAKPKLESAWFHPLSL